MTSAIWDFGTGGSLRARIAREIHVPAARFATWIDEGALESADYRASGEFAILGRLLTRC